MAETLPLLAVHPHLYDDYSEEKHFEPRPHDHKIDEAKDTLSQIFHQAQESVFYGRQLEVLLEDSFFHWITTRALSELVAQGKIKTEILPLKTGISIRIYWSPSLRYWKRAANKVKTLVEEHSRPEFAEALGVHCEMMFDAALPTVGFFPKGRNVREFGGKQWTQTGHNLDRVFERDGIAYGTEIKNTLDYISWEELTTKINMCHHLSLRPLFILRHAPKNYIQHVRLNGGFTLIFKWQLYPLGYLPLAKRSRAELGLPVDCPKSINQGTVERFLKWHLNHLTKETN